MPRAIAAFLFLHTLWFVPITKELPDGTKPILFTLHVTNSQSRYMCANPQTLAIPSCIKA